MSDDKNRHSSIKIVAQPKGVLVTLLCSEWVIMRHMGGKALSATLALVVFFAATPACAQVSSLHHSQGVGIYAPSGRLADGRVHWHAATDLGSCDAMNKQCVYYLEEVYSHADISTATSIAHQGGHDSDQTLFDML